MLLLSFSIFQIWFQNQHQQEAQNEQYCAYPAGHCVTSPNSNFERMIREMLTTPSPVADTEDSIPTSVINHTNSVDLLHENFQHPSLEQWQPFNNATGYEGLQRMVHANHVTNSNSGK